LNEAFVDSKGNPMDQKDIVKQTHDALVISKGNNNQYDFEKFKSAMTSTKQIQGPGLDPWKVHYEQSPITDEKTLKKLFDSYRPVAELNASAFIWLINKIYDLANEKFGNDYYADFVISVKNQHHFDIQLKSNDNVSAGNLNQGQTKFITAGPFAYRYQKGLYYDTKDSAKTTDISIVINPNLWTLEAKTPNGQQIMKTVLNDRKAFDTYSGWYTGEVFNFILYKFKAPKTEVKPVEKKEGDKIEEPKQK